MDAQIKKGAVEMCVLHILNNGDSYGYDVTEKYQNIQMLMKVQFTLF